MKGPLVAEIAVRCAKLAVESDESGVVTFGEYVNEYLEQLENGEYLTYLKSWIGYMIENGSKEAVEIMKRIIRCEIISAEWTEIDTTDAIERIKTADTVQMFSRRIESCAFPTL